MGRTHVKLLPINPLTREAFAPFGDVIECAGARHYPINAGTTERYHDLARIEPGDQGRTILSIFRGLASTFPLRVALMERHPLGSQAFVPLQNRCYLVVVADPADGIDAPGQLHAFLAQGHQGVNYRPGVWHHPLIAVGAIGTVNAEGVSATPSDFLVIDREGPGPNCDEQPLAEPSVLDFKQT